MARILLVEDDEMIASGLSYALEQEGYDVARAKNAARARELSAEKFELAILDMQLPDGTGLDVSETLRESGAAVIFLTVVDDEGNVVRAFEAGAQDYVTKPFRLREFLARVKRVLDSRSGASGSALTLTLGGVTIDAAAGKAYAGETQLELTALEYRLLLTFANNRGRILSRGQILESIWDSAGSFVEDNTLSQYIKRLRNKLSGAANIETVRGLGYRADF
ncbi:MAG: response regulator transcription factor [Oscillospiraceae bacterium]|nr:response regulator transcription factor [Oscillospiraceae bacterium]